MLARENRLTTAADFKAVIKTGRKANSQHTVIYLKRVEASAPARFGFLVSKLVGNAVKRNLVKRRLREIVRPFALANPELLVVVRALPGAAEASFDELKTEVLSNLERLAAN